ncbi:C40 family peptidase [Muribaculum intestinale]|uniref:C40 family peptidase n=1 Tax=Muribaculum intestinale TaxID=1796646 RepID=UPI0026F31B78|nr:C40 family peptidase [Muribaculum intestinale]
MMLRSIAGGILMLAFAMTGTAQNAVNTENVQSTHRSSMAAHRKAHERLANANIKMDMSVIGNKIQEDIAKREEESNPNREMLADLIKEAKKHIGKPYVHGMKGPRAFDCSGFSSYVYRQFGYNISPASRMQYTEGVKVDRKNLREGDLVFFTSRSSGRNVGHVGIVVTADNTTGEFTFIHASLKGVKISDCKGYYANRYVGAKRIIQ